VSESHRVFVGGNWDRIGTLQLDSMMDEGLKPGHYFLDLACGALRAGIHFIPYLDEGHYWGLDKRQGLITAGIDKELDPQIYALKGPRFIVNANFDLSQVPTEIAFDYVLAASLFTHLLPEGIEACVKAVLPRLAENGRFYATYLLPGSVPSKGHLIDEGELSWAELDLAWFEQAVTQMGAELRLVPIYDHPLSQKLLCISKKGAD